MLLNLNLLPSVFPPGVLERVRVEFWLHAVDSFLGTVRSRFVQGPSLNITEKIHQIGEYGSVTSEDFFL